MDPDELDDEPLDDQLDELTEDQDDEDQVDDLDEEPDDQDDEPEPEPQPASRKANRVATLAAERKAEKERADRAEARLAELERGTGQPQKTPQQLAAERNAHLATLTEAGRLEFLIEENKHETRQQINAIQFASFDATDKAAFDGMCAHNPAVSAVKAEVETTLQQMRANGTNAPRETVAAYVIGQKALNKQPRAKTAGAKRAAEGRERQGARPVNGRGDVAPNGNRRGSEAEQRRKRLADVNI